MFSSTSYPSNTSSSHQNHGQEHRPGFPHSHSQPFMVAGMTSQAAIHSPSLRSGALGSTNVGGSLSDTLTQSRGHYQPGYLLSASQSTATSQSPRYDDVPVVQTKAKMNHALNGTSAADFGMDSMFETLRHRSRQTFADEDAPPMSSVNDIPDELYDAFASRRGPSTVSLDTPVRNSIFRPSQSQIPATPKGHASGTPSKKPIYVIVFGYPPDRYSAAAEYFRSLGDATEVDPNLEITNCFRIGYSNSAEAMRAVRKNGEVLGGSWMVGVKWADPTQAEALLGTSLRSPYVSPPEASTPEITMSDSTSPARGFASQSTSANADLALSTVHSPTLNASLGTPIRLAPSASAFKKPTPGNGPGFPLPKPGAVVGSLPLQPGGTQSTPSKSVLGQVSDLIFGW
ncbi:uncharacterized protein PHACADRAFT_263626 [Phanerochaete carnosa HHB-10118-sp]|uniref:RRM Nup35-type domain-containing protein n=1 Tax=Phanerochaete carnosa (strain HHB-10118-sp) TaxID=650164 RepID=K5VUB4_PHACS|nr:uncharacterized protein PHACADRAFT_263626 [Phanerochaete carnosa HHB-10118-sp]EKM50365.1 hypothetical protein PHACADRAFT_263626 [Phanerochaete carnosa HHB-10118-sp]